ncbi:MAG: hypothetical protein KatS3mg105_5170 [Gemmatales bacterium]|nr:MAG: hypothetical protein KatS3mg105_4959 [Gemmatales bacterium]GIW83363.1 MAG: hypothetical protein KatS3mg105_5170 [Gemmatales bacterium]
MRYLLDANVFITAKNLHYGFDFCPAFWDWLLLAHENGTVFSIEKVHDELMVQDDELTGWAEACEDSFFIQPDEKTLKAMGKVSAWVQKQPYTPAAKNTFFQKADYYLIAQALAGQFAVVTHERPAATVNKVKIPDVCIALKLRVVTPFEMLRIERARFVLRSGSSGNT